MTQDLIERLVKAERIITGLTIIGVIFLWETVKAITPFAITMIAGLTLLRALCEAAPKVGT